MATFQEEYEMSPHANLRVDDRAEVASPSLDKPVASRPQPQEKGKPSARKKPWEGPSPIKNSNDDNGPRNG